MTGAASGIGFAIADHLAARGAEVVLADLPGEALERSCAEIEGGVAIEADLAEPAAVARVTRRPARSRSSSTTRGCSM